jgi:hypothetical protein
MVLMDKKKELIGDVLVAALYAEHRGWGWRPFTRFTGDSIRVNNRWEPVEPFEDTLFGRRQLEALLAHFGGHVEYELYEDIHVLRAYNKLDDKEQNIVTLSLKERPNGEDYRKLHIRFIKKCLNKIFKDVNHTQNEEI